MTHDEIIAMAREEGLSFVPEANSPLVRIVRKAVAKERDACLLAVRASTPCITENDARVVANCLGAIRARGQKEGA